NSQTFWFPASTSKSARAAETLENQSAITQATDTQNLVLRVTLFIISLQPYVSRDDATCRRIGYPTIGCSSLMGRGERRIASPVNRPLSRSLQPHRTSLKALRRRCFLENSLPNA